MRRRTSSKSLAENPIPDCTYKKRRRNNHNNNNRSSNSNNNSSNSNSVCVYACVLVHMEYILVFDRTTGGGGHLQ